MRAITILGSTGSIGTQALDVVRRNPDRFKVAGLSAAGTNQDLLVGQIREFLPPFVAIADEDAAADIKAKLGAHQGRGADRRAGLGRDRRARHRGRRGPERARRVRPGWRRRSPPCRAARRWRSRTRSRLVVGGELVMDLIKGEPERLLPVDSEHAALAHGPARRAPRGPQARRPHGLRAAPSAAGPATELAQGLGEGGAAAPGVDAWARRSRSTRRR